MVGLFHRSLSKDSFEDIDHYLSGSRQYRASAAASKPLFVTPSCNLVGSYSVVPKGSEATAEPARPAGKKTMKKSDALLEELLEHVYADPVASKETKQDVIKEHLVNFLHATYCTNNNYSVEGRCRHQLCVDLKEVIEHQKTCPRMIDCMYWECTSMRQVMLHWNDCQQKKCWLCGPVMKSKKDSKLKNRSIKQKSVEAAKNEVEVVGAVDETKKEDVKPQVEADSDKTKASNATEKEANRKSFEEFVKNMKAGCRKMRDAKEKTLLICIIHIILSFVKSTNLIVRCASILISMAGVYISMNLKADFLISHFPLAMDICAVVSPPEIVMVWNLLWAFTMSLHFYFLWILSLNDETILEQIKSDKNSTKKEDSGKVEAPKEGEIKDNRRLIRFPSSKIGVILAAVNGPYAHSMVFQIAPEGAAEDGGQLRRGDLITRVNGFLTCGKTASKVVAKIGKIDGPVWLEVINSKETLEQTEDSNCPTVFYHI